MQKKIAFSPKWYHFVYTTFVDILICETFHSHSPLYRASFLFKVARTYLNGRWLCLWIVFFGLNLFLSSLASLIKNGRTFRNCYLFSCRCRNVWDIGMCLKPHFYICKFKVNCDRRTRCTNSWSNLTLNSNANTFVKVDAQIEENCRRTISYLQGYSCPKLQLQETE